MIIPPVKLTVNFPAEKVKVIKMYQLEIDNTMADEEYDDVGEVTPLFDTAIAQGARSAVIWLTRKDGSRHVIALHPIPEMWINHNSIKRGAT